VAMFATQAVLQAQSSYLWVLRLWEDQRAPHVPAAVGDAASARYATFGVPGMPAPTSPCPPVALPLLCCKKNWATGDGSNDPLGDGVYDPRGVDAEEPAGDTKFETCTGGGCRLMQASCCCCCDSGATCAAAARKAAISDGATGRETELGVVVGTDDNPDGACFFVHKISSTALNFVRSADDNVRVGKG